MCDVGHVCIRRSLLVCGPMAVSIEGMKMADYSDPWGYDRKGRSLEPSKRPIDSEPVPPLAGAGPTMDQFNVLVRRVAELEHAAETKSDGDNSAIYIKNLEESLDEETRRADECEEMFRAEKRLRERADLKVNDLTLQLAALKKKLKKAYEEVAEGGVLEW